MRKGLYEKLSTPVDATLSQVQDRVSDVVDKLSAAHDVVSSPVVRMVATGVIAAGAAVVIFAGGPGCSLTLPAAGNQGSNIGSVMMFVNRSTVPVTLKPSSGETVKGAASLAVAAGGLAILVSDGANAWFSQ